MQTVYPGSVKKGVPWVWWVLLGLELLLCLVILLDLSNYTMDDGYIYLGGARQLARGELPNPTPGEAPTNAFGSHIWLTLLAPAYLLGLNPLVWGKVVGFILLLGGLWQLAGLLRLWRPTMELPASLALAGVALTAVPLVYGSVNLLETALYLFALLTAVRLTARDAGAGRPTVVLGLSWSLLLLSRPDAFLELVVLLGCTAWLVISRKHPFRPRDVWRPLVGLLPGLAVLTVLWSIYGTPLPHSALAKTPDPAYLFSFRWLSYNLFPMVKELAASPGVLVVLPAAAVFLFRRGGESPPGLPLRVSLALLIGGRILQMWIVNDWTMVNRLWVGGLVLALACALLLLYDLLTTLRSRAAAILLLGVSLFGGLWGWRAFIFANYAKPTGPAREMGELINELALDDSWLLTPDMGVTPYYAEIPTLDAEVHPVANRHLQQHPGDLDYVLEHQVDFVIVVSEHLTPLGEDYTHPAVGGLLYQTDFFHEHFRPALIAEWRQSLALDIFLEKGGRYFHLFISDRIDYDVPEPLPIKLRYFGSVPPSYPRLGIEEGFIW
jgi:hypothetical protein